jgi:pimeloyl-ACP methyl ester carboxylesterase
MPVFEEHQFQEIRLPEPTAEKSASARCCLVARQLLIAGCLFGVLLSSGCFVSRERAIQRIAYVASFSPAEVVTVKPVKRPGGIPGWTDRFAAKSKPSQRTEQFLRKYNVLDSYRKEPARIIHWLQELATEPDSMEEIHALAELAEIEADWLLQRGKIDAATSYYATAVIHAYQFLFAPRLDLVRNAYDPQFRSICDIYNRSLEGLLRQHCQGGSFMPGKTLTIGSGPNYLNFEVEIAGRWKEQEFERFEMVSDYQTKGLVNRFTTYGLGVPMIGIRKQQEAASPIEAYYPPTLSLALTAFGHLRIHTSEEGRSHLQAVVTLYDPLEQSSVSTEGRIVPLESDITTPLAYIFRDPIVNTGVWETAALFNAELTPEYFGMYLLEPYDPEKTPVVMVHGLWSSPMTWVQMFNDLRANPEIRGNFQFWFYAYPTGQPFWYSAKQMRRDLAEIKQILDPLGQSRSLTEMILVGHSMGGLVSLMQTLDSEEELWEKVSRVSLSQLDGSEEAKELLQQTFYFQANPDVARVITIATPFQGSDFASKGLRWASRKLFTLPQWEADQIRRMVRRNRDSLYPGGLLEPVTSLDSLTPGVPIFEWMVTAKASDQVQYHNIFGRIPHRTWLQAKSQQTFVGDGIVLLESSRHERAESEFAVNEHHADVHQNSACIFEVRRILLEHLIERDRIEPRLIPDLPVD